MLFFHGCISHVLCVLRGASQISGQWLLHQILPFLPHLPLLSLQTDSQSLSANTLHLVKSVVCLCLNLWISLLYFDFLHSPISTFMNSNDWVSRIFFLLKSCSVSTHLLSVSFEMCGWPCFNFLFLSMLHIFGPWPICLICQWKFSFLSTSWDDRDPGPLPSICA